jgi:hypothetical protein
MPEHGGQNAGHTIGDGSSDRVPLPAHSFDPSQRSHRLHATSPRLRRMLRLPIQGDLASPIASRFHGAGDRCRCGPGRSLALPSPSTLSSVRSHSLLSVFSASPSARSKSRSCAWAPTMQSAT